MEGHISKWTHHMMFHINRYPHKYLSVWNLRGDVTDMCEGGAHITGDNVAYTIGLL